MTFMQRKFAGHRVQVQGTDRFGVEGSQMLNSAEWDSIAAEQRFDSAVTKVDDAIATLLAPVLSAIEEAQATGFEQPDPLFFRTVAEGVEPVAGQAPQIIELQHDTVILRALAEGHSDRLAWVEGKLEVLALDTPAPVVDGASAEVIDFTD